MDVEWLNILFYCIIYRSSNSFSSSSKWVMYHLAFSFTCFLITFPPNPMKQSCQNRKKGHINHCSPMYWEWNGASQQFSLILKCHYSFPASSPAYSFFRFISKNFITFDFAPLWLLEFCSDREVVFQWLQDYSDLRFYWRSDVNRDAAWGLTTQEWVNVPTCVQHLTIIPILFTLTLFT